MASKNDLINKRLKELNDNKEKMDANRPKIVDNIVKSEDSKPDFKQIAEELRKRKEAEAVGANEGYVKDTIYIRQDLFDAMQALCLQKGDKKKHCNRAYEDYIIKMHEQLSE